jgi:KDO2-lipid IV(A) lauroyltransferase
MATIGQRAQAAALGAGMAVLRALGPAAASNVGGFVARLVGPRLSPSRVADANLRRALPELDEAARRRVIRAVWDNVGRVAGELPHLAALRRTVSGPGWELAGEEHVRAVLQAGEPVLFFSGHFGNWEMMLPCAAEFGIALSGVYRAPSNPAVDALMLRLRLAALHPGATMFAKGASGARQMLKHVAAGRSLGLLADQKMNDGIPVPFFGRPAMTAPALAQFALRYGAPLLPARVDRIGPARFRIVCEAPIHAVDTGNRQADVMAVMTAVNATLERWVRADPGNWLWLHRRWPKEA